MAYTEEAIFALLSTGSQNWGTEWNTIVDALDKAAGILTLTAGEQLVVDDVVFINPSDGKVYNASALSLSTMPAIGLALQSVSAGQSVKIRTHGWHDYTDISPSLSATAGDTLYLSEAAGGLTNVQPDNAQPIGFAKSDTIGVTTRIFILPLQIINNIFSTTGGFSRTLYFASEVDNGNSGPSKNIDLTAGNKQKLTLTDNCTVTFTEPDGPCNITLRIIQNVISGVPYVITWPADVYWAGGGVPDFDGGTGSVFIVSFYYDGFNFYGQSSDEMSIP
jgi:hypothetical protein